MIRNYLLAFIPVFVAVDAIGILPIFMTLTRGMKEKDKRKAIFQSFITAVGLALVFILIGKGLFSALGISVGDFMIAGGAILFCIAIMDLIAPGKERFVSPDEVGSVPLGTPLIVGPGVLTTCLIIVDQYGIFPTIVSVLKKLSLTMDLQAA